SFIFVEASLKADFLCLAARVSETRPASSVGQPDDMVLFLPLPYHEQTTVDRLIPPEPRVRIRDPSIVHIDAARLHEPPCLALGWGKLHARQEIDHPQAIAGKLVGRHRA